MRYAVTQTLCFEHDTLGEQTFTESRGTFDVAELERELVAYRNAGWVLDSADGDHNNKVWRFKSGIVGLTIEADIE